VRNLLIFLLVLGGIWWVRRALKRPRRGAGREPRLNEPERVLACAHCGVHVPESEGVRDESGFYCSEGHRRLGNAGRGE
jgi:uncharacterized protein